MRSETERVVFNRALNPDEYLSASLFMMSLLLKYKNEDYYYYVNVGKDMDMNVTTYASEEVQWQANELMCTDLQAVFAIAEYDGFYEDLTEILWKNNIGGYNRYVAQTTHTLIKDEDVKHCIAKSEKDAMFYFDTILGVDDILTIREDNEEIF